jgi:hypothetical protein
MKKRMDDGAINLISWHTIDQAMKELLRQRRVFVSKHSVGMCGVGKFMK